MPRHLKKHRHLCRKSLAPDPLVDPGNPPHRHQARPPARPARSHHRMVVVAARPPGPSSPCPSQARKPQKKNATVMLRFPTVIESIKVVSGLSERLETLPFALDSSSETL